MIVPEIYREQKGSDTLLGITDHHLPVVSFMLGFRYGAVADPADKLGLCYVTLEHVMRGTKRHSRREYYEAFDVLGSSIETSIGRETAFIRGTCLARHFDVTMDLLSETVCEPAFSESEFGPLRDECLEEVVAERDDDDALVSLFFRDQLFGDHVLGRPTEGDYGGLSRIDRASVVEHYQKLGRRWPIVFGFGGDVTPGQIQRAWEKFDRKDADSKPEALSPVNRSKGLRIRVVDKPDRSQVQMRIGQIGSSGNQDDALALYLAVVAFGGTFTSPYTQEIRDQRGWSYDASAHYSYQTRFETPITLTAAPALEDALDCLEHSLDMFGAFCGGHIDEDVLAFTKGYLLNRFPFTVAVASDVLYQGMLYEYLHGKPQHVFTFARALEALQLDSVAAAVKARLSEDDVCVTLVASEQDVMPALQERFSQASIEVIDYRRGIEEGLV